MELELWNQTYSMVGTMMNTSMYISVGFVEISKIFVMQLSFLFGMISFEGVLTILDPRIGRESCSNMRSDILKLSRSSGK